jgi:acetyl-CoA carboxylase biotin carboxylase subunit
MKAHPIQRILIANRGEIAVRVIRACRELGITPIAVYSDVDRKSLHVRFADEAYPLHGLTATETYLHQDKLLEIAKRCGANAIHPGYGFLSENPDFADRVQKAGLRFIGPKAEAIRAMGDKTEARKLARKLGVPTIAGTLDEVGDVETALNLAQQIGFPVLLKAAAGGGGKGMRVVMKPDEMSSLFAAARSEARSAFDDDRLYIEKLVERPRHVEIQILSDEHGNALYLGERECSIQRRHQKVIEESPSPMINETLRKQMGEAAVALAKEAGYTNAGTVEFLVDKDRSFYFLEMNTRLQVEHPVTELTTGIDLVKMQIHVAEGKKLEFSQGDLVRRGHAIECRIYAEDPDNGFFPSTGTLHRYSPPEGPGVRVDNGFEEGSEVSVYYDPLLCKVITYGNTRAAAIETMKRALREFEISGVRSTIPFCHYVLNHPAFVKGEFSTAFVDEHFKGKVPAMVRSDERMVAALGAVLGFSAQKAAVASDKNGQNNERSKWKNLRTETYRS